MVRAEATIRPAIPCASAQHGVQKAINQLPKWRAEEVGSVPLALGVDALGVAETLEAFDAVISPDSAGSDAAERQIVLRDVHNSAVDHGVARRRVVEHLA